MLSTNIPDWIKFPFAVLGFVSGFVFVAFLVIALEVVGISWIMEGFGIELPFWVRMKMVLGFWFFVLPIFLGIMKMWKGQ